MTYIMRIKADELLRFARREHENNAHYNTLALIGTANNLEKITAVSGNKLVQVARKIVAINGNWRTYVVELNKLGIGVKEMWYD